jgi:hypothetical protein
VDQIGHFSPAVFGPLSREGVGHRVLFLRHEIVERFGAVAEPMNDLSFSVMRVSTMSRWRLFTGASTGSRSVPPTRLLAGQPAKSTLGTLFPAAAAI